MWTRVIRNLTILPKLLSAFLLAIVPLFFVSLQMNRMGAESVREEMLTSMKSRVQSNMHSLEDEMKRLTRLHEQYVLDDDFTKLSMVSSILPYYEVMLMEKRVQNKLWVMKNSNLYVTEAKAYIPLIGKTIFSLTFEKGMTDEEVMELQELQRNQVSPIVYWQGKLLINSIYPNPSYSSKPPVYVLQSEMDQQGLQNFLKQIVTNKKEGALLFNEKQNWTLYSHADDSVLAQVKRFVNRQPEEVRFGQGTITIHNQMYYVTFERSSMLNMDLVIYVPEEQVLGPLNKYRTWFWIMSGMSLLILLGFSYWIFRLIHSPLRKMVRAFRRVEKGDLSLSIQHKNYDEFQYLYGQFNMMVRKLKQSIQDGYESRIMAQHSELKQLQSQINPHFLYNTYFMVHRMAEAHDVDNVSKATKYLGEYFLYITRNSSDVATLEEEWNHTIAYIEIQQLRFYNRVDARISSFAVRPHSVSIPRLILQPLVENAYQHGLKSKVTGGSSLCPLRKEILD
ncbi:histidine kinase [Paenibacillus sp. CC-CFT747]|nr:histidine kinase [Paenibacillus sp. CC-CFT747]